MIDRSLSVAGSREHLCAGVPEFQQTIAAFNSISKKHRSGAQFGSYENVLTVLRAGLSTGFRHDPDQVGTG